MAKLTTTLFNKFKRYSILRKIYSYYFKTFYSDYAPQPKYISLDITHKCNLNCIMCNRRLGINNKELCFESFVKIIDQFPRLEYIGFMGLGEVFMNKDFIDMLRECEKRKIDAMFTTNGVLLNENNIKRLPKNVKEIFVSIDSLNPEFIRK